MAMDAATLENIIISKVEAAGFITNGEHSFFNVLAQAVAEAVVEHISSTAEVPVTSGSSAGSYKVK
jgi:6,7-dimethyl-8-ribityllumazine synthase